MVLLLVVNTYLVLFLVVNNHLILSWLLTFTWFYNLLLVFNTHLVLLFFFVFVFSEIHGLTSRNQYFLQNFTWLSKFHLPSASENQLIYRGVDHVLMYLGTYSGRIVAAYSVYTT